LSKPQKTKRELELLIRSRTLGMRIHRVDVRPDPALGWSVVVIAAPLLVAKYQKVVNEIAEELRGEFDLKDE
jgi:hypothetical protein